MKNKEKGFTVIELVLALTITVMVLGSTLTIFILSTKIFTDIDVKSTLQTEAQNISQKVSNVAMESSGITTLILSDGTDFEIGKITEKKYSDLTLVDSNGKVNTTNPEKNQCINIQKITISAREEVPGANPTDPKIIDNVNYTITHGQTVSDMKKLTITGQPDPIGEYVESITIKPGNPSLQLSKADSIQLNINLAKKLGFSDIKYSIPINITFRNKTIS